MKFVFLALTLISSLAFATPEEERICNKTFEQNALDEVGSLFGDGYFPEEVMKQIDPNRDIICASVIVKGTFKIIEPGSPVCAATADYAYSCKFPKKGGGYLDKSFDGSGSGCCSYTE